MRDVGHPDLSLGKALEVGVGEAGVVVWEHTGWVGLDGMGVGTGVDVVAGVVADGVGVGVGDGDELAVGLEPSLALAEVCE